jgi:hypothetical protein
MGIILFNEEAILLLKLLETYYKSCKLKYVT